MNRTFPRMAMSITLMGLVCSAWADSVNGPAVVVTDTPTDFRAIGSLTTIDDTNPVNGVGGNFLKVESPANPNWSFEIGHISANPHYALNQGKWEFKNVSSQVRGSAPNNVGHLATPHAGEQPNPLVLATSRARDLEMGDRGRSLTAGGLLGHNQHFDAYTFDVRTMAIAGNPNPGGAAPGPSNLLTGGFELVAKHQAAQLPGGKSRSQGGSFYSDPEGGSWVSYDARSKSLTIHAGSINGLDFKGGRYGGVESAYKGDAMLDAKLSVSTLKFKGMKNGVAQFGEGTIELRDPDDGFSMDGAFPSFNIADSTSFPVLESFAILNRWSIERAADPACASPFFERWVRHNLLGDGMSAEHWRDWNGIDVALVTETDLMKLTEQFTASVDKTPATVYITLNLKPEGDPEPEQQTPPQDEPEQQATQEEPAQETQTEEKKPEGLADQVTDFLERTFPGLRE